MITCTRPKLLVVPLVAVLAFAVGACGGDDDGDAADQPADATTTTSPPDDTSDDTTAESTTPAEFEDYVGLPVDEAGAKAEADDRVWRVVMVDGESLPVTLDFNPTRLNFVVVDGAVTAVSTG